jgi:acetyl esterase
MDEEPAMPLDPDAERVIELVRLSGRPPYEALTPPEARALFLAGRDVLSPPPQRVAEIRELSAPGKRRRDPAAPLPPARNHRHTGAARSHLLSRRRLGNRRPRKP